MNLKDLLKAEINESYDNMDEHFYMPRRYNNIIKLMDFRLGKDAVLSKLYLIDEIIAEESKGMNYHYSDLINASELPDLHDNWEVFESYDFKVKRYAEDMERVIENNMTDPDYFFELSESEFTYETYHNRKIQFFKNLQYYLTH